MARTLKLFDLLSYCMGSQSVKTSFNYLSVAHDFVTIYKVSQNCWWLHGFVTIFSDAPVMNAP